LAPHAHNQDTVDSVVRRRPSDGSHTYNIMYSRLDYHYARRRALSNFPDESRAPEPRKCFRKIDTRTPSREGPEEGGGARAGGPTQ